MIHVSPSGKKTVLTKTAGDYSCIELASDGACAFVGTLGGKLFSFELPKKSKQPPPPRELFAHPDRIWSVAPVAGGRIVIGCPNEIHLLSIAGAPPSEPLRNTRRTRFETTLGSPRRGIPAVQPRASTSAVPLFIERMSQRRDSTMLSAQMIRASSIRVP